MNRLLDILLCLLALAVLFLPGLVIVILLKLTGEKEAFYFQPRVGQHKQLFTCWKLITMRTGSEKTGTGAITIKNDPRVTPLGRFLRKTKINELPQLINVLKGDMSLVGPRPLTTEGFGFYTPDIQDTIAKVKPGLTGIGSIVFRDEEQLLGKTDKPYEQVYREDISPYKGALERWYVRHQSVWLNIKIIMLTAVAILLPRSTVYRQWLRGIPEREQVLGTDSQAATGHERVLVIGGGCDNLFKFRGRLLRDMQNLGHHVMTCAGERDEPTIEWLSNHGMSFDAVEIERRGINPFADLSYYRQLKRVIEARKPTVVLSYTIKPVIYGTLAARHYGVPHIAAMVTGAGMAFVEGGMRLRLIRSVTAWLLRFALHKADVLIFQNHDDIDLFRQIGAVRPQQQVIKTNGSGVDLAFFMPSPPPTDPVTFLLLARLIPEKGIREYAEAAALVKAKHPEARFMMMGPYEQMRARITSAEVEHWQRDYGIEYGGSVRDVRPYLEQTSVYVLPSYYREGQPRSILEALAVGRAVITCDSPGCRETVEEGVNGILVPPRDPHALADAMTRFIENPKIITEMGEASLAIARDRYAVEKVNEQIIEALQIHASVGNRPSSASENVGSALHTSVVVSP